MEQDFVVYRRYSTQEEAEHVKQLFAKQAIEAKIAINTTDLEGTMAGASVNPKFELSLHQTDFERADELLIAANETSLDELDADYYLFQFTAEELEKPESGQTGWITFGYIMAFGGGFFGLLIG